MHKLVSESKLEQRYEHINNFEKLLRDHGTHIIKIHLNISKDYQLKRLKRRLEKPEKWWKFNPGDLDERKLWDSYRESYEEIFKRCSSKESPWYIIPGENRRFRTLALSQLMLEKLESMDPKFPEATFNIEDYPIESLV